MSSADAFCCPPLFRGARTEDEAVELSDVLKAMADPTRLRLLSIIASAPGGEACACDFPEARSAPADRQPPPRPSSPGQASSAATSGGMGVVRLNDARVAALCDCLAPAAR